MKIIISYILLGLSVTAAKAQNNKPNYSSELPKQYIRELSYFADIQTLSHNIDWRKYDLKLSDEVKSVKFQGLWLVYDRLGRAVDYKEEGPAFAHDHRHFTYEYDAKTRTTKKFEAIDEMNRTVLYNEKGLLLECRLGNRLVEKREYLPDNRISTKISNDVCDSVFYANDGSFIVKSYEMDDEQRVTNLTGIHYYDKHGVSKKYESPDGKEIYSTTNTYTYHPNGRVKTFTQDGVLTGVYDENGYFLGSDSSFKYDEKGRLLEKKNYDGTIEKHIYKKGVRIHIEVYKDGKLVKTLKCDKYGNPLELNNGITFQYEYF
ncbi:MAG: hypothetical protein MJZ24_09055 [Paludibacteraceae bacterium]|nr:hypothetical protein [Paludibacteraceae bacterium]